MVIFLFSILFRNEKSVLRIYYLLFVSAILLFVFQIFQTIFNFSILPLRTNTLIGSWNELGIFFGFIAFQSVILFELLKTKRIFFLTITFISLLMMAIVNFSTAWLVLGVFLMVFLTYLFSVFKDIGVLLRLPLFITILSFLFIISQPLIGSILASPDVNINFIEVRPSWSSTFSVINSSIEENSILGSGPNTFIYNWLQFKPSDVNLTAFWASRFQNGVGLIPSFAVTTGILGIIAWIVFFVFFIKSGLKIFLVIYCEFWGL